MARMTPSDVRDTHHRLWVGEKTPASRAWSAEIRQFLEAVLAKAKSHEITHEEARRQVKQMIQTHGHARYIHGPLHVPSLPRLAREVHDGSCRKAAAHAHRVSTAR